MISMAQCVQVRRFPPCHRIDNFAAIVLTTSADGRLFGLFVVAPAASWEADKDMLRSIRDSFKVYKNSSLFAT